MSAAGSKAKAPRTNAVQRAGQAAFHVLSVALERANLAYHMGLTHGGRRNIWRIFGYPQQLRFEDFYERFDRQGVAYAVITRPVEICWGTPPDIVEAKDEDTDFENGWKVLVDQLDIFGALERVDIASRIGKHAVLLLGFDDVAEFKLPVKNASNLRYLTPYTEGNAKISRYDKNPKSPRFNLPETYSIRMRDGSDQKTVEVHWSRIIHVAEGALENTLEGHEQLRAIYNNLMNLELVSGASPEMYWRSVARLSMEVDPSAEVKKMEEEKFKEEVEEFTHDFKPWMVLEGIKASMLSSTVADPTPHISVQMDQIAMKTGYPKRWLMGSEVGELASTQDAQTVASKTGKRQTSHCERRILRPLIGRLIDVGVLPKPKRYVVEWPPVIVRGDKEEAEIGAIDAQALASYAGAPGTETVVPPEMFLRKMLRWSDDDIKKAEKILNGIYAQGADDEAAARAAAEEEAAAAAAATGA